MKVFSLMALLACASLPVHAQENQHNHYRGSIGLGAGMLYGLDVGLRADYRITEQVTVNLGMGFDEQNPSIGMQYHFVPQNRMWQPRIGLHYGVIDSLEASLPVDESNTKYYQKTYYFKGFAFEAGQSFNFGKSRRHGVDLSFTLCLGSDQKEKKREELGMSEGWFEELDQAYNTFNIGYKYNY
ncbi:hypothetical protein [Cellvibrio sp. NN19]|uniref:hypothetical protein n=1 Tax=Cellvibrio chitinivorans TaxID=3102792 RepID=UPI002B40CDF6|nr:hypothetical protein [Cellvibrio sp. NN19]